jgi:L-rhamnose mutarotase
VRPDKVDAYVEAHRNVWPEMLEALREAGIRNYTIFRAGHEMFGYFESDDLERAASYLAAQEVCTRWQDAMAELLEQRVPDSGPPPLEEIFRLD